MKKNFIFIRIKSDNDVPWNFSLEFENEKYEFLCYLWNFRLKVIEGFFRNQMFLFQNVI